MKCFLHNSCIVLLCWLFFSCKKNSGNDNSNPAAGPKAGSHWIWNEYVREDGQPEIKLANELHWVARDSTVEGIQGLAIYGATTPPGGDPQVYGLYPLWFIYNKGDLPWKLKNLPGSGQDNGATDDSWLEYPDVPGGSYFLHNAWYPDNYTGHSFVSMTAKNYSPGDTVVTNPHNVWEMKKVYTEGGAQAVFTNYYTDNGPLLKQSIYRKNFNPPTNTDYEEHEYRLKGFTR